MSTLQSPNTWLNLNRFSTHHEASIDFIKYVSTGLTLHHIAKNRVSTALTNVDPSPEDIIVLKEATEGNAIHNYNNKRKPDEQLKVPEKKQKRYHFPCIRLVHETYRIRKWKKPSHHGNIRRKISLRSFYYS